MVSSDFYKGLVPGILLGVILGPLFLNLYIYNPINVEFLAKILSAVNLRPYMLNELDPLHRAYIEGMVDGIYLADFNSLGICRYSNVKEALNIIFFNANLPCIEYQNGQIVCPSIPVENATLFVIFDSQHLRTAVYENNTLTIIDVTDQSYRFNPSSTTIMECHVHPITQGSPNNIVDIITSCNIIYLDGLRAFDNLSVDGSLYEYIFKYNAVDVNSIGYV